MSELNVRLLKEKAKPRADRQRRQSFQNRRNSETDLEVGHYKTCARMLLGLGAAMEEQADC
jgi:hypothetical protein